MLKGEVSERKGIRDAVVIEGTLAVLVVMPLHYFPKFAVM